MGLFYNEKITIQIKKSIKIDNNQVQTLKRKKQFTILEIKINKCIVVIYVYSYF